MQVYNAFCRSESQLISCADSLVTNNDRSSRMRQSQMSHEYELRSDGTACKQEFATGSPEVNVQLNTDMDFPLY